jgi:hypothetical protein
MVDVYCETCWLTIFNARYVGTDLDLRLGELRGDLAGRVASKKGCRKRNATMQYITGIEVKIKGLEAQTL